MLPIVQVIYARLLSHARQTPLLALRVLMELFVRIYQSPERKRVGFFRTLNTYPPTGGTCTSKRERRCQRPAATGGGRYEQSLCAIATDVFLGVQNGITAFSVELSILLLG